MEAKFNWAAHGSADHSKIARDWQASNWRTAGTCRRNLGRDI